MNTRDPDAFVRISADGEMVLICTGTERSNVMHEATPTAAREIARNLMLKADEIEVRQRSSPPRHGHLRRVK